MSDHQSVLKHTSPRTKYSERIPVRLKTGDVNPTKQNFKELCDINKIVKSFVKTGYAPMLNTQKPQYGDFSDVGDYQESMIKVLDAKKMFHDLPRKVRKRFDNDPAKLMEFVSDEKNRDEAIKLGLVDAPPAAPVAAPTPATPPVV